MAAGRAALVDQRQALGGDDKVLCVPATDPRMAHLTGIGDISEVDRLEIQHFFET